MHYVDSPVGVREEPGPLVRSAGKQFYDPDDGSLVGAWLFDEGLGLFVRDRSIYGNHGLITGADWVPDGLDFVSGNSDYVDCGNDDSLKSLQHLSIVLWLNPDNIAAGWSGLACKMSVDAQKSWELIKHDADGYVRFGIYLDGATLLNLDTAAAVLVNGQNAMLTATYDGHYQKLFADGILSATSVDRDGALFNGTSVVQIGRYASNYFDGTIHSIFIYNRALTDAEILVIYQAVMYRRTESYRILGG